MLIQYVYEQYPTRDVVVSLNMDSVGVFEAPNPGTFMASSTRHHVAEEMITYHCDNLQMVSHSLCSHS